MPPNFEALTTFLSEIRSKENGETPQKYLLLPRFSVLVFFRLLSENRENSQYTRFMFTVECMGLGENTSVGELRGR